MNARLCVKAWAKAALNYRMTTSWVHSGGVAGSSPRQRWWSLDNGAVEGDDHVDVMGGHSHVSYRPILCALVQSHEGWPLDESQLACDKTLKLHPCTEIEMQIMCVKGNLCVLWMRLQFMLFYDDVLMAPIALKVHMKNDNLLFNCRQHGLKTMAILSCSYVQRTVMIPIQTACCVKASLIFHSLSATAGSRAPGSTPSRVRTPSAK